MDKYYKDYLEKHIPILKAKLLLIEQMHGRESERWNIAHDNLLNHEYFLKHGVPRNVNQSVEIPYDLIEGF
jgi:hypothetical protein